MTTTASRPTRAESLAQVQALIAGTQKHFSTDTIVIGCTRYTAAALVQALQQMETALVALSSARASMADALAAVDGAESHVGPVIQEYKRYVLTAFGPSAQQLADFGMQQPKTRTPLDSEARALATAKLRATRAARGTTSRKQKLAIKGNVTGITVTPITSPAPTPPAVPASSPMASTSSPAVPASPPPASAKA